MGLLQPHGRYRRGDGKVPLVRGLQLTLIYATWVGSLLFGYLHFLIWLLVPFAAWSVFAFSMTGRMQRHQHSLGITSGNLATMMFVPNALLVLRNAAINAVIFALAWGASLAL